MSKLLFRLRPAAQGNPATKLTVETQPQASVVNGAPFSPQPTVQVRRADNSAVAQAGVVVTAALATGAGVLSGTLTAVTDSSGLAAFNNLRITGATGARTLAFSSPGLNPATSAAVNITAGAATQITSNSVTNQSGTVSAAVGAPPSVLVQDASGNPVPGVAVAFAVTAGGGTRSPASVNTNASGVATLTSWTLGPTVGTNNNTLTATVAGLTGSPVTFTASAAAAGAAVINYLGFINSTLLGNSREVWIYLPAGYSSGTQRYPVLYLHDGQQIFGSANPFFMESKLTPLIAGGTVRPTIIVAVAGKVNALQRDDEYRIVSPAKGELYARMMVEEMVPYIDANYRTIAAPYARGTGGFSLGGILAFYTALKYPNTFGLCMDQSGVFRPQTGVFDHVVDAIDYQGPLPFRFYWDRGDAEGGGGYHEGVDQEMRVALLAKGEVEGIDFKYVLEPGAVHNGNAWKERIDDFMPFLYAPPAAAARISAYAPLDQAAVVGTNVKIPPAVLVRDQWGNPVAGRTINFTVTGGGGSCSPASVVTDANGVATLGTWTAGPLVASSNNVLTATSAGLVGSPVTFKASGVAASDGVVDGLGILRAGMDPTHTMFIGRIFGSVERDGGNTGQSAHGGALLSPYVPYGQKYCERYDDAKESGSTYRVRDYSVPFQEAREQNYRQIGILGRGQTCAWYMLVPGQPGQQAWGQTGIFQSISTRYVGLNLNQNWWELDYEDVFKFLPDFPAHRLNKHGFIGISTEDNACMGICDTLQNGALGGLIGPFLLNLQATCDNNLTAAPGDRGGMINFNTNPPGNILMQNIAGGVAMYFQAGRWYKRRRQMRMSTHNPVDRFDASDGWAKFTFTQLISAGVNGSPDIWGTPVAASGPVGARGLNLELAGNPAWNQQSYFRSIQDSYQNQSVFPGSTRFIRSGDHGFVTTLAVPFQINGINDDTLPAGAGCAIIPTKILLAGEWAALMVSTNAAKQLSMAWVIGNYATAALAEAALPLNAPNNKTEIGYLLIQAGPSGWTATVDALTGGTAGNPAAVTQYRNRSGVYVASHFLQMKAS